MWKGDLLMEKSFAAAAAMLLAVSFLVFGLFALEEHFSESEVLQTEEKLDFEKPEPEKTLLGIFDGKLALFVGESPYPNRIYDFLTRNLPEKDRESLLEGIEINSEEELEALLEDFMS